MDRWQYLIVLGACLLITAPLEMFGDGRLPAGTARRCAVLPVAAVFVVWDAVAIAAHVWTYNPRYVTGIELPADIPIEELLFFLVIPLCGLLTYTAVDTILTRMSQKIRARSEQSHVTGLGYTLPAVLAVIAVCALEFGVLRTGLFRRPAYWISMVIVFGFQIPVDGWLTKLSAPIVIYDDSHTSGIRFPFDIPVEDFLFGFALVTAVLLLWERQRLRDRKAGSATMTDSKCREVPAAFDAGARRLRRAGGRQPRLPPPPADVGAAHAARQRRRRDYGCSTPAAAPARPPPRCCPSPRTPRSSPSTRRRACWPRPPPSAGPQRCGSCTAASRTSPRPASTGRSTASSPLTCCATSPIPTPNCACSERCCGPARRWPCTSTRSATPGWPPRCGTRCARRSSSRWAGCAAVTPASTATCGAA